MSCLKCLFECIYTESEVVLDMRHQLNWTFLEVQSNISTLIKLQCFLPPHKFVLCAKYCPVPGQEETLDRWTPECKERGRMAEAGWGWTSQPSLVSLAVWRPGPDRVMCPSILTPNSTQLTRPHTWQQSIKTVVAPSTSNTSDTYCSNIGQAQFLTILPKNPTLQLNSMMMFKFDSFFGTRAVST